MGGVYRDEAAFHIGDPTPSQPIPPTSYPRQATMDQTANTIGKPQKKVVTAMATTQQEYGRQATFRLLTGPPVEYP